MKQMKASYAYKDYWKHNAAQSFRQPFDNFPKQTITGIQWSFHETEARKSKPFTKCWFFIGLYWNR